MSPTSVADVIEVTGVVQVGQKVSAIIKAPQEASSRYVSEGEYLAGGILVKRIELGTREEPLIVLEQNGVEIIKSVGSAGNTVARAF
jgi:Tfp pilus assembly protein PilP